VYSALPRAPLAESPRVGLPSECTAIDTFGAMTSGTWPVQSLPPDYLPMGSLGCIPPFPCLAPPIRASIATGGQIYNNFATVGSVSRPDIITAPGGLPLGFPISSYPVDAECQTSLEANSSPWSPAPGGFQKATICHGNYSGNQTPTHQRWVPLVPLSGQQLAIKYPIDADYRSSYYFQFGHTLQPPQKIIDWGDSCAVATEIHKLKQAWREGVGVKRRHRKSKKQTFYKRGTGQWVADQERDRVVWTGESLDSKVQATTAGPAREYEDNFNKTHTTTSPTSSRSNDSVEELIAALEQLEKNKLLLSPEVTLTSTKSPTNNNSDRNPPNPIKERPQPLRFSTELKAVKIRTSVLAASKETPSLKGKTSSTSLSKVVSLRPPKAIARSSKPVTQPVPFNLVGSAISRKLKLKREQQR
jgi:hypothetical protein